MARKCKEMQGKASQENSMQGKEIQGKEMLDMA
jgi:hypothetical protein